MSFQSSVSKDVDGESPFSVRTEWDKDFRPLVIRPKMEIL